MLSFPLEKCFCFKLTGELLTLERFRRKSDGGLVKLLRKRKLFTGLIRLRISE